MIELNFSKIRNHDGSQDNGFEELVCQLAHLSPPDDAKYFVRKDGSGGDAGVECYWKLNDDTEHGWQAKFFIETMETSQWEQISKSVEAALYKHPKLTKYYVCLPRDWNDSRKKSSTGQTVTSSWDRWLNYVKKWEQMAFDLGMQVEFTYWGKHEISQLLQCDQAVFSGRARYWFGTPILRVEDFKVLAEKSKVALGERYTPEYHLDLPIVNIFEALGNSSQWKKTMERRIYDWIETVSQSEKYLSEAINILGKESAIIENKIDIIVGHLKLNLKTDSIISVLKDTIIDLEELDLILNDIDNKLLNLDDSNTKEMFANIRNDLIRFSRETIKLIDYFQSNICQAAIKKSVILIGEAGIGKSHLLCDIALSRIQENLPTVFLLGQHYSGGNPLTFIKDYLGLNEISKEEFLGALDGAGEAQNTNTLIIIDAINEGNYREDWESHISSFLLDIERFKNISIVLSCRETYVEWLIPNYVKKNQLLEITHTGFRGYEHRAAANYLNRQGILKPSAPIISPEFTNPLFLKTCCKAIIERELTAFPKGLNGISALLNFYIEGIEVSVSKIKKYRIGEKIVRKALNKFALALYPNNIFGIDISEACDLINQLDSRPGNGETLFDILINEGVLSEDLEYNEKTGRREKVVVRFTYERFSDYFIALSLIENLQEKETKIAFTESGCFASIVEKKSYNKSLGILSVMSIIISEKYGFELIDLLPDEIRKRATIFERVFLDTIQWRARTAFSDRTKELLNSIRERGYHSRKVDILLALSTEPLHPWNAEMLHKKLVLMKMPERDLFWSTHITVADFEEGDGEEESVERAIIEWAYSGSLEGVEVERIRLCAMTLLWMTSSSNKKVRDQATKSAIRILIFAPELLIHLLEMFANIDDLYVVERLYAVAYGVVTNIDNAEIVKNVSTWVYNRLFIDRKPIAHLLLRDYARGILEYADYMKVLVEEITTSNFLPPYNYKKSLSIPSVEDLDTQFGEDISCSIRSSLMGFPGDFGNYTMGCIRDWSSTPIDKGKPQTVYELQMEFADNYLNGELKKRFVDYLEEKRIIDSNPFDIDFSEINSIKFNVELKSEEEAPSNFELLKRDIEETILEEQKEYFSWLMGLGNLNSIVAFSKESAQRWVCKRAIELGWTKEYFEEFERLHCGTYDRSEPIVERIGKKYQWIALYEFLAHLSDNYCYVDPGYSDVDYSKYFGPWQIHKRDIDPTFIKRSTGDSGGWNYWDKKFWWQPYLYPFTGETINELQEWLWDETIIPNFEELLKVSDSYKNSWIVLRGFSMWKKDPKIDKDKIPYQDAWYRINSCIIEKKDMKKFKTSLKGKNLCSPDILKPNSTGHQGFFKEYPWHPVYKDMTEVSDELDFPSRMDCRINYLITVAEYEWESNGRDHSNEESISFYLPSKKLIDKLNLLPNNQQPGCWVDANKSTIFFDPSIEEKGPSVALIKQNILYDWLEKNNLQLVWLIGGEKQLFTQRSHIFYGRLVYSGFYTLTKDGIKGDIWFEKEKP